MRVSMCREDRSEQAIGFFWTRWSPSERSEEVVFYDGTVEGDRLEGWKSGRVERSTLRRDVVGLGNFSLYLRFFR